MREVPTNTSKSLKIRIVAGHLSGVDPGFYMSDLHQLN